MNTFRLCTQISEEGMNLYIFIGILYTPSNLPYFYRSLVSLGRVTGTF